MAEVQVRIWMGVSTRVFIWGELILINLILNSSKVEVKDLACSVFNSSRTSVAFLRISSFVGVPTIRCLTGYSVFKVTGVMVEEVLWGGMSR